jgi:hypothetical protein
MPSIAAKHWPHQRRLHASLFRILRLLALCVCKEWGKRMVRAW